MSYYIFLKSLRSLEEFRKNPHVKIPPKSPSTNFQSLAIIKIQFFIQKTIFLHFRPRTAQRPVGPSGLSARPLSPAPPLPRQAAHACSAHPGLCGLGVIARSRLYFEFAQLGGYAFPFVTATWAHLSAPSSPPRRCLTPWMPPSFYSSPSSLPPLTEPLSHRAPPSPRSASSSLALLDAARAPVRP
jgi:hypothetical protein